MAEAMPLIISEEVPSVTNPPKKKRRKARRNPTTTKAKTATNPRRKRRAAPKRRKAAANPRRKRRGPPKTKVTTIVKRPHRKAVKKSIVVNPRRRRATPAHRRKAVHHRRTHRNPKGGFMASVAASFLVGATGLAANLGLKAGANWLALLFTKKGVEKSPDKMAFVFDQVSSTYHWVTFQEANSSPNLYKIMHTVGKGAYTPDFAHFEKWESWKRGLQVGTGFLGLMLGSWLGERGHKNWMKDVGYGLASGGAEVMLGAAAEFALPKYSHLEDLVTPSGYKQEETTMKALPPTQQQKQLTGGSGAAYITGNTGTGILQTSTTPSYGMMTPEAQASQIASQSQTPPLTNADGSLQLTDNAGLVIVSPLVDNANGTYQDASNQTITPILMSQSGTPIFFDSNYYYASETGGYFDSMGNVVNNPYTGGAVTMAGYANSPMLGRSYHRRHHRHRMHGDQTPMLGYANSPMLGYANSPMLGYANSPMLGGAAPDIQFYDPASEILQESYQAYDPYANSYAQTYEYQAPSNTLLGAAHQVARRPHPQHPATRPAASRGNLLTDAEIRKIITSDGLGGMQDDSSYMGNHSALPEMTHQSYAMHDEVMLPGNLRAEEMIMHGMKVPEIGI